MNQGGGMCSGRVRPGASVPLAPARLGASVRAALAAEPGWPGGRAAGPGGRAEPEPAWPGDVLPPSVACRQSSSAGIIARDIHMAHRNCDQQSHGVNPPGFRLVECWGSLRCKLLLPLWSSDCTLLCEHERMSTQRALATTLIRSAAVIFLRKKSLVETNRLDRVLLTARRVTPALPSRRIVSV